jgi:signal transduction histidine kinase
LVLVVENDIQSGPDQPMRIGTGLGTTRDRLRLLYGEVAVLETTATAGRFRVTVSLPARVLEPIAPAVPAEEEHAGAHS